MATKALKEWSSDKTDGNDFCKIRNDEGNDADSESLVNRHTSKEVEAEGYHRQKQVNHPRDWLGRYVQHHYLCVLDKSASPA